MFNFDIKKTAVYRAQKTGSLPHFKYAGMLAQLFLFLLIISLALVIISYFGFYPGFVAGKIAISFLFLFLLFFELYLFAEFKIKEIRVPVLLKEVVSGQKNYPIEEFLSLQSCQIIEHAIKTCREKKLSSVPSEAIFYSLLVFSLDARSLMVRLGVDVKKLQADLKNYLQIQPAGQAGAVAFSDSFQKTMETALAIAAQRGLESIGDKELLAALAVHDPFFKKLLVEHELKENDVEHITLWLDVLEATDQKNKTFWAKENLLQYGSLGKNWASGFTIYLDRFSIDWRHITGHQIFHGIIGHKKEVDELETVLAKTHLSNALILGEPGIGRKSIVQALAQRCYLGMSLPELNNKRVVELDMVRLISQAQGQKNIETLLHQIFSEVVTAGNVILVIDNFDEFVEQKVSRAGAADISGILAKYLAMPNFQFIAISSFEGLRRHLEQNPALLQYFRKIEVSEISEMETISILMDLALGIEYRYKLLITYPAIREIVALTGKYFPGLPFPKKAIDVLDEAVSHIRSKKEQVLLTRHVADIISEKTNIPVGKMEGKEKSVLLNLEKLIHQKIINQAEAVTEIATAMRRARSGLGSKKRPMGSFLFLGPTGVGKTETAKALAEIYFGGVDKMIRLDMSEFQTVADIPRLLGAVSPVEQQGLLTTPVREKPFSLVVCDEIEKAHPDILNLFLQILDEGHITDGQGRKVIFTNTIIICTSNAGASLIFEEIEKGIKVEKNTLLDALFGRGTFKPEFINRFDATVIFHTLTRANLLDIAELLFAQLAKNLKEKDIELVVASEVKKKIVDMSYKPEFGAREMRRVMQDTVENSIAEALLAEKITKGDKIEINPEHFEVVKISATPQ